MNINRSIVPFMFACSVFLSNQLFATSLEQEFRVCAAAALESRLSDDAVIHVDLSQVKPSNLATETAAGSKVRLELQIADSVNGVDLGEVVCLVDSSGELISAEFKSTYVAMN